jgi:hypothetical protein
MLQPKERFLVDEHGQHISVLLEIADYQRLLEPFEELEAIRAYNTDKASRDEVLPREQALAEIDKNRP